MRNRLLALVMMAAAVLASGGCTSAQTLRGTGDLGVIVERSIGRIQIVESSTRTRLASVDGLGDLSHATVVFSRDARFAYVFGRDGGLSKVDLLTARIVNRIVQAGNSIGGAISEDGRVLAVGNYEPGGVRLFDADSLALLSDIPAIGADGVTRSKVVGLADVPGHKFVFSLYEAGEVWVIDCADTAHVKLTKYLNAGKLPYDGMISPNGHYYAAALFGEDGLALLDLWRPEAGLRRILDGYGRGSEAMPVYKMPHMKGWASTGDLAFVPAIGHPKVLLVDMRDWTQQGEVAVHGQPVFNVARPDGRQVWVNFAHPDNDVVQVIDVPTRKVIHEFRPGKAVLHIEFTPRGDQAWISVRDEDKVEVFDTETFAKLATLPADKPSGIFFTARAHRIGY